MSALHKLNLSEQGFVGICYHKDGPAGLLHVRNFIRKLRRQTKVKRAKDRKDQFDYKIKTVMGIRDTSAQVKARDWM